MRTVWGAIAIDCLIPLNGRGRYSLFNMESRRIGLGSWDGFTVHSTVLVRLLPASNCKIIHVIPRSLHLPNDTNDDPIRLMALYVP